MKKYFYCYSYPLKSFLISNGEKAVVKGIHPETKKRYWVFEGTKELNQLLSNWAIRKNNS